MSRSREILFVFIGGVIAVLLQIIVAPAITIFTAEPNILLAYVMVVSILRASNAGPLLAFVLGLIWDLIGTGPVGGMAFIFVFMAILASRIYAVLDNDTLFMRLIILVLAIFIAEILYGILLMLVGMSMGFIDALIYRALPCGLYSLVVGLIIYPLIAHFFARGEREFQMRSPQLH